MAVTATPVFVQTPNIASVQILNADASNFKNIMAGGANGSKIESLQITSTDSTDRVVQIYITKSGSVNSLLLGSANVAANSGNDNLKPAIDAFNPAFMPGLPIDSDTQKFLFLKSGDQLNVKCTTTVTAAKNLDCTCVFADF